MAIPSEVQQSALHLFKAVIEDQEASPEAGDKERDSLKGLLEKYYVTVSRRALPALADIVTYVTDTHRTAEQLNRTIYRSWSDVVERSEVQLKIDQWLYYLTKYGGGREVTHSASEFDYSQNEDGVFIPARFSELRIDGVDADFEFECIDVVSKQKALEDAQSLLCSGTALSQETILRCLVILAWADVRVSLDQVRNREVRAHIVADIIKRGLSIQDADPLDVIRAMFFQATGSLLVIKSKVMLSQVESSGINIARVLNDYPLAALAAHFNRFRPIFIALKRAHEDNRKVINSIARLSKSHHQPLAGNPLNEVTHKLLEPAQLHWLHNATVAAQIRALYACRLAMYEQHAFRYQIRNGKMWVEEKTRSAASMDVASQNFAIILEHLQLTVGEKLRGKRVYIPANVEYGLPLSEKQMLGNIPFRTKFAWDPTQNFAVGIFYKAAYNCGILDLAGQSSNEETISWYTKFKSGSFVHSGDLCHPGEEGGGRVSALQGHKNRHR